jgi:hypothetical protein
VIDDLSNNMRQSQDLVSQRIGIDTLSAKITQAFRDEAFSAGYATGQPNDWHFDSTSKTAERFSFSLNRPNRPISAFSSASNIALNLPVFYARIAPASKASRFVNLNTWESGTFRGIDGEKEKYEFGT